MKKFIALSLGFLMSIGMLAAQASVLSETNKALDKANTTMYKVNQANNNIQTTKKNVKKVNKKEAKKQAKKQAKQAAKNEAKKQANRAIDRALR